MTNPIDLNSSPLNVAKNDTTQDGLEQVQTTTAGIESKQGFVEAYRTNREKSIHAGNATRRLSFVVCRLSKESFDKMVRLGTHALGIYENETSKAMTVAAAGRATALSEKLTTQEMAGQLSLSSIGNEAAIRQALNQEAYVKRLEKKLLGGEISQATFEKLLARGEALDIQVCR